MAVETMEYAYSRIRWGPLFAGALCAVAVQIVLGLFGASFGFAGGRALSAIWEILTPPVALFAGSMLAVSLDTRRSPLLTGFMVWCIYLAGVAFYLVGNIGMVTARADAIGVTGASAPALAALSAVLGLFGAGVGSVIGRRVAAYEVAVRKRGEREEEELEHPETPLHH